jgi:aryl-alcohol dehydrogenase-like predicted oxidoreductase
MFYYDLCIGSHLEAIHESAYFYWYNRLRKLRRTKKPDIEAIARVSAAFEVFKKETVRLKKTVKSGKMSASEFSNWLIEQESVVDGLIK